MKLLVFGGTLFVGRHVVVAALAAGHDVATFNRGVTARDVDGVEALRGDRDHDLSALAGRVFDAVIDCSGYTPREMTAAAAALGERCGHDVFVSSRSVYRGLGPAARDGDETAPLREGHDGYGALKARSEEAIAAALPGRVAIVRPGLVAGPHDPTNRFTYWPVRLARGGDVLAPGRPGRQVQSIDARNLAAWCVRLAERGAAGTWDVVGPTQSMAMLLATIHEVTGTDARLHWMSDRALVTAGVEPWTGLPLWIPETDADFGGLMLGRDARAVAAGLVLRPLADTVRDTLAWAQGPDARMTKAVATLAPLREAELLAMLAAEAAAVP